MPSVRPPESEGPRGERLPEQLAGKLNGRTVKLQHSGLLGCVRALFASPPPSTGPRMHPQWESAIEQALAKEFHPFIDMCVTYPLEGKRAAKNHLERELNALFKAKKSQLTALQKLNASLLASKELPADFKEASRELRSMITQKRETLKSEISTLRTEWQGLDYTAAGAQEKEAALSTSIVQKQEEDKTLQRYDEAILSMGALDHHETENLLTSWALRELAENHVTQSNLIKEILPNFVARRDALAIEFTAFLKEQGLAPADTLSKLVTALLNASD